ncbi:hypothetical protein AVEN_159699-1 [Araneus ventricosus]|uniref:Uncharacterized protein n=1 Tax=Araneus ventricosus TaxID=182803 RepID=A0A4Y2M501_ARAVE|nr:hypothetical protein AVEN_159699-1 [Araneus ventricosus]
MEEWHYRQEIYNVMSSVGLIPNFGLRGYYLLLSTWTFPRLPQVLPVWQRFCSCGEIGTAFHWQVYLHSVLAYQSQRQTEQQNKLKRVALITSSGKFIRIIRLRQSKRSFPATYQLQAELSGSITGHFPTDKDIST